MRADKEVEVLSMGYSLEITKQVGSPVNLDSTYHLDDFCGSHGIGHTRLSTESSIDLSHSQPFWSHGNPDLAIAHNGHITNYRNLRCKYEQNGFHFYTQNDSEIIGVYIGEKLSMGMTLAEAMHASLRDFDGSFSYLAATEDSVGFAKDPFGFKPLLMTETDGLKPKGSLANPTEQPSRVITTFMRHQPVKYKHGNYRLLRQNSPRC